MPYATWPDARSWSRSWRSDGCENGWFQSLISSSSMHVMKKTNGEVWYSKTISNPDSFLIFILGRHRWLLNFGCFTFGICILPLTGSWPTVPVWDLFTDIHFCCCCCFEPYLNWPGFWELFPVMSILAKVNRVGFVYPTYPEPVVVALCRRNSNFSSQMFWTICCMLVYVYIVWMMGK